MNLVSITGLFDKEDFLQRINPLLNEDVIIMLRYNVDPSSKDPGYGSCKLTSCPIHSEHPQAFYNVSSEGVLSIGDVEDTLYITSFSGETTEIHLQPLYGHEIFCAVSTKADVMAMRDMIASSLDDLIVRTEKAISEIGGD